MKILLQHSVFLWAFQLSDKCVKTVRETDVDEAFHNLN